MKKKWLIYLASGLVCYVLLLVLLYMAERQIPGASIQSFADALWYSIVTLSTVGYGDLYPVSPAGKLIGVLFVLLSVGALAFLVGTVVNLFTGRLLPTLRLRLSRSKKWYVFSQVNEASLALAASILEEDQKSLALFPLEQRALLPQEQGFAVYPGSLEQTVRLHSGNCTVFFMDAQSGSNFEKALAALDLGCPVYCRTEQTVDQCPPLLHLFDRYSCCARDYWNHYPLRKDEQSVVLIGDGRYAWQLLEQGLLTNIFGFGRHTEYHVFGDWEEFCRLHPQLDLTLDLNTQKPDMDRVLFHREPWSAAQSVLSSAGRIIVCGDDERGQLNLLHKLRRYVPVAGNIHLRSDRPIPAETVFGTLQQIYTAENVMAQRLTQTARRMHKIYLDSVGGGVPWEQLSDFTRRSNLAAADHLAVKMRLLLCSEEALPLTAENCKAAAAQYKKTIPQLHGEYRAMEHLRWMRFHSLYNWRFAPVRDNAMRLHPMIRPYEQLSLCEQEKDDYAWQLLDAMAKEIEKDTEDT